MHQLENVKLKVKNLKPFGEEACGFDTILPVNLIIGRNNSGKSTLLDVVHYATDKNASRQLASLGHQGRNPEIFGTDLLTEDEIKQVFKPGTSGGTISGNHWDFAKRWVNSPLTWRLEPDHNHTYVSIQDHVTDTTPGVLSAPKINQMLETLVRVKMNPFKSKPFRRIQSDRDMIPEPQRGVTPGDTGLNQDGTGATNLIREFVNRDVLPTELVKETMLSDLNLIFQPDSSFVAIDIQQHNDSTWEVYLREPKKAWVPLSQSGSGLKTVLLVLVFLHLVPFIEHNQLSQYIFGFEELENNLHPALQRRLFRYLRKMALETSCVLFISTQSSVVIDLFSRDENAQIIHVTHDGERASARRAVTYVENRGILDDLDVRASDILQSNSVVWVEGPSDRLYFNRWIELWTGDELREGAHYQCVFYGGKLLAHLSAAAPEVEVNDLVKILRVNRHAILLSDSDLKSESDELSGTKQRLVSEIQEIGGVPWVTSGREIEHYIPIQTLRRYYKTDSLKPVERFQSFSDYLEQIKSGEGKSFKEDKVLFAARIIPYIQKEDLATTSDLGTMLDTVCREIRRWNGLDHTPT